MSSLFRRIAGAIVELEPETPAPASTSPPKTLTPATASTTSAVPLPVAASAVDDKLQGTLQAAALARKTALSGVIEHAEKLRAIIADETQRIQAAAIMVPNATADVIGNAAATHLADLANERARFSRELAGVKQREVTEVLARAGAFEEQVRTAQQQIAALQQSIDSWTAQAATLQGNASQSAAELDQEAARFDAAAGAVTNHIETMRDAIVRALAK